MDPNSILHLKYIGDIKFPLENNEYSSDIYLNDQYTEVLLHSFENPNLESMRMIAIRELFENLAKYDRLNRDLFQTSHQSGDKVIKNYISFCLDDLGNVLSDLIDFSQVRPEQEKQVLKELWLVQITVSGNEKNSTLVLFDYALNGHTYENLSVYRNDNFEIISVEIGS